MSSTIVITYGQPCLPCECSDRFRFRIDCLSDGNLSSRTAVLGRSHIALLVGRMSLWYSPIRIGTVNSQQMDGPMDTSCQADGDIFP